MPDIVAEEFGGTVAVVDFAGGNDDGIFFKYFGLNSTPFLIKFPFLSLSKFGLFSIPIRILYHKNSVLQYE